MEKLEEFDFGPKPSGTSGRWAVDDREDWSTLFDGTIRVAKRDEDYDSSSKAYAKLIRRAAWKRGFILRVRVTEASVTFKAEPKPTTIIVDAE